MFICVRALLSLLLAAVLSSCGAVIEELVPDQPVLRTTTPYSAPGPSPRTIFIPQRPDRPRVQVTNEELQAFVHAVVSLIRTPKQLGAVQRPPAIVPVLGAPLEASRLVQHYVNWCERRGLKRDCVGVLHDGFTLSDEDKPRIAMDLALGSAGEGFKDELRRLGDPNTVRVMVVSLMVMVMAAVAVPTVVTQLAFAGLTTFLIAYLGVETVWNLGAGYLRMDAEARVAETFGQLREAGERYGTILGGETAKVVIMLVLGALSEGGLVARLGILPKAAQASELLAADTDGLLDLKNVGGVSGIRISPTGATITLNPAAQGVGASALAMTARGTVDPGKKVPCRHEEHHISTPKNSKAAVRGGPWTPRFQKIFAKAGLSMDNKANIVNVYGHVGPHPEEYHQAVYDALERSTRGCATTEQCRALLVRALADLAEKIATPGSTLNDLITRDCE